MFLENYIGKEGQFQKYPNYMIDSLGVEYDYESVMHYGRFDFSKYVFLPTLRAKKPGKKISPSRRLSPLDAKQANLLYKCNKWRREVSILTRTML